MTKVTSSNTTSTAIADDFADIAARMKATPANGATAPDAELIGLCDRLVALEAITLAFYDTNRTDAEIAAATAPAVAEHFAIRDRVVAIGLPKTQAGGLAFARAAYALAPRCADGSIITSSFAEWMAFAAAQRLSSDASEPAPRT